MQSTVKSYFRITHIYSLLIILFIRCNPYSDNINKFDQEDIEKVNHYLSEALSWQLNNIPDSTLHYALKAKNYSDSIEYLSGSASASMVMAKVLVSFHDYDNSIYLLQSSIENYIELNYPSKINECQNLIEKINKIKIAPTSEAAEKELKAFNTSVKMKLGYQDDDRESYKNYIESVNCMLFNDTVELKRQIQIAFENNVDRNDSLNFGLTLKIAGIAFQNNQQYATALYYLDMSNSIFKILQKEEFNKEILRIEGECEFRINQFEKAYNKWAQLDFKKDFSIDELPHLINVYQEAKNYEKASDIQSYYIHEKDSISNLHLEQNLHVDYYRSKIMTLLREETIQSQRNKIESKTFQIFLFLILLFVAIIAILILIKLFNQRRKLQQQTIELKDNKIQELFREKELSIIRNVVEIQEFERKRIAEDLHDRLGSKVSTIKLYLMSITDKIKPDEILLGWLNKSTSIVDETIDEIRMISHSLATGTLMQFGLVVTVEDLLETINKSGRINTQLIKKMVIQPMDNQIELEIYRIFQELITNTLKHAFATEIIVEIFQDDNKFILSIQDNGKGFDIKPGIKGIGLQNVSSRIMKLKGDINIIPLKPNGSRIQIIIPYY